MSALSSKLAEMDRILADVSRKVTIKAKGLEKVSAAQIQILVDSAKKISPIIQGELSASYGRSGLGIVSGQLQAAVAASTMVVANTGIKAQLPGGKAEQFYKYASSQQNGWVTGKGSRRLKSKVKKFKLSITGMKAHAGHKYYKLDADQTQRVAARLVTIMQPVITKLASRG
jgi:hypothetical protein